MNDVIFNDILFPYNKFVVRYCINYKFILLTKISMAIFVVFLFVITRLQQMFA